MAVNTPLRKPPRNEHELELALVRMNGNDNARALSARGMMANAILGQMLPKGAVLKGGNSWCTISLEVSHSEAGAAERQEFVELRQDVVDIFRSLAFPAPERIPLMPLDHQVAQKLHGASGTSEKNRRAHDIIDLQLMMRTGQVSLTEVKRIAEKLFRLRRLQPWPTLIVKHENWDALYNAQKGSLPVLPTVDEAIAWANKLITTLSEMTGRDGEEFITSWGDIQRAAEKSAGAQMRQDELL